MKRRICVLTAVGLLLCLMNTSVAVAQVTAHQKISNTEGSFDGMLDNGDQLGVGLVEVGDLDGDGVTDIVAGALMDDDGGSNQGAVWVLFLNPDGSVKSHQKISETEGGFSGTLDSEDRFGHTIAGLEDLDGDGIDDLAVGAFRDDDGGGAGSERGAVWVLFLDIDGTVKSHQKISDTEGGFTGTLIDDDFFGGSVTGIGDLDGDGISDLAVGASGDDDGGNRNGAVWILFLDSDGTVKSHQKISDNEGGFTGTLEEDFFGDAVAGLGDLDGDGVNDLAVGADRDDDGGSNRGAAWVLFLNNDGTVKSHQKISDTEGGFTGTLDNNDYFGRYLAAPGDLNGDGAPDLTISALEDDDGGSNRGAAWILFLNTDGTVKGHRKISDTAGGFTGVLDNQDHFGIGMIGVGDLNGDGAQDLATGAPRDDDGGTDRGAVWVLFSRPLPVVPGLAVEPCIQTDGLAPGNLDFDSTGILYAGTSLTNTPIWRVGVGGASIKQYGAPIYDPDGVVADEAGTVTGQPGSVLVGSLGGGGNPPAIYEIATDETTSILFAGGILSNPQDLVIDGTGRLLIADTFASAVLQSAGGAPTALFPRTLVSEIALDQNGHIYSGSPSGIQIHDSNGTLVDGAFVTGYDIVGLDFGPITSTYWNGDLVAITRDGRLLRVDAGGTATQIGAGFAGVPAIDSPDVAFGPNDVLHVSATSHDTVYCVKANEPPVVTCSELTESNDPGECSASLDCESIASCHDPEGSHVTQICDPPGPYQVGVTSVTVECSDDQVISSDICHVTVEDNEPPEITAELYPSTLWPPNHRMVNVEATVTATDNCETADVVLSSISSNEADNGAGDGNTINDIQDAEVGVADFRFRLRAERAGGGTGRIYTAAYSATDGSGNSASAAGFSVVPHDQGGMTDPVEVFLEKNGFDAVIRWNEVPGAQSYDVIRGQLGNISETLVVIDLGAVTCIENGAPDATSGCHCPENPNPGQAYFYLVAYDDGTSSSYGTESADRPRAPASGDCH